MTKSELRAEKRKTKKEEKIKDKARIKAERKKDREDFFKIDDPIGFMRVINVLSVIFVVMGLFLGVRYLINSVFVFKYNHGSYTAGNYNAKI